MGMNSMGETCAKCNNPLTEGSWQCDICGAAVLPAGASFVARHPTLRRVQTAGVAVMTVVLGLGLGLAIIVAIQLNKVPAAAQTTTRDTSTTTPLFVPAIVSTSPPSAPSPPADPQYAARDLLGQATRAMADLRGYELTGNISDGSTSYTTTAAILPPDRFSLTLGRSGGLPGPQQRIVFSNFTIYSSSDGQTWQQDSSGMATALRLVFASLWSGFDAKAITDPAAVQIIGDEVVGSTVTTRLRTDFATVAKAHSLLLAVGDLSAYKGSVDVWVSKTDRTIRRLKADVSNGSTTYRVDVTFSNFNGDVKVAQPTPLAGSYLGHGVALL